MANWNDPQPPRSGFGASPSLEGTVAGRAEFDMGLRRHMLSIYNYMASGVLLTGVVAMMMARSGLAMTLMTTPLRWLFILSPLAIVMAMSFGRNRFSTSTLKIMFWAFATLMGVSMSTIFLVYTGVSIATTFFATAAGFAGLSLFGYTTQKDLSGMGSFLIMGVVGIIIAMVINMFLQSTAMHFAISAIGVLIFAGLTAYDTQMLKNQYIGVKQANIPANEESTYLGKAVVMGALSLYLDFINMFQFLLTFLGSRE